MGRFSVPESQVEPGTRLVCGQCGGKFEARNKNGVPKRFCSAVCRDRHKNARRLKGAALLKGKNLRHRGPSKHALAISQCVFLALVPIEERAELLRLAAENLGITNRDAIDAAMRRAQAPSYEGSV